MISDRQVASCSGREACPTALGNNAVDDVCKASFGLKGNSLGCGWLSISCCRDKNESIEVGYKASRGLKGISLGGGWQSVSCCRDKSESIEAGYKASRGLKGISLGSGWQSVSCCRGKNEFIEVGCKISETFVSPKVCSGVFEHGEVTLAVPASGSGQKSDNASAVPGGRVIELGMGNTAGGRPAISSDRAECFAGPTRDNCPVISSDCGKTVVGVV
jgi:hypothetical protein